MSDDERREVAERLRAYGKEFGDPTWRELCNVVFGGDNRFPTTVRKLHLIDRLADLIDPGESGHESGHNPDTVQIESPDVRKASECDREALLMLAEEMEKRALTSDHYDRKVSPISVMVYATRIREACGEVVE